MSTRCFDTILSESRNLWSRFQLVACKAQGMSITANLKSHNTTYVNVFCVNMYNDNNIEQE